MLFVNWNSDLCNDPYRHLYPEDMVKNVFPMYTTRATGLADWPY